MKTTFVLPVSAAFAPPTAGASFRDERFRFGELLRAVFERAVFLRVVVLRVVFLRVVFLRVALVRAVFAFFAGIPLAFRDCLATT